MKRLAIVRMSHAAAIAAVVAVPSVVVAAGSGSDACHIPAATPLDQRVEHESQKGIPSFVRFIHRTQSVFQLDVQTEVAKIDSRRAAERECIARLERDTTIGAADAKTTSVPPVVTAR